jgi:hypothetical protein
VRTQIPGSQILDLSINTADIANRAVTDSQLSLTGVTAGSYTKVDVSSAGRITAGYNPSTLAGYGITDAQALNVNLSALAGISGTGLYAVTAAGSAQVRTLVAPTAGFTISNASGVVGNPTFALADDLNAVESLTTTGIAVRSATSTWLTRTISAGTGIGVANGDGLIGNPTISLSTSGVTAGSYSVPNLSVDVYGRVTSISSTSTAAGSASGLIGTGQSGAAAWTLSGSRYYADFTHNLGTYNVVVTIFDSTTNTVVIPDSIVLTSTTTARVYVIGNTRTLRVVVVANGLAINTATQSAGTITTQKDGSTVNATASTLNFTGPLVKVSDAGSNVSTINIGSRFTYFAASLDSPVNSDFAVNANAAIVVDPSNPSILVRQFSNTTEQGVGFLISIPSSASSITFKIRGRAAAAPATVSVIQPKLYVRQIPNNAAIGSWAAGVSLGLITFQTNTYFQYSNQSYTLSSLGLTAGSTYQLELTRPTTVSSGTALASAFLMTELTIELA